MKPFAKKFYGSSAWEKCRASFIVSKFGLCNRCGSPGKIVHHIEVLNEKNINDPSVTLNHDLLELLCQECHNKEHMSKEHIRKGLEFNELGELIQVPPFNF